VIERHHLYPDRVALAGVLLQQPGLDPFQRLVPYLLALIFGDPVAGAEHFVAHILDGDELVCVVASGSFVGERRRIEPIFEQVFAGPARLRHVTAYAVMVGRDESVG
jgi:hypothetical protein